MTNRRVHLKQRPVGAPTADDFSIVDAPLPIAQDGEVLRRTVYLSLDPYMRGRISAVRSYGDYVVNELRFDAAVNHRNDDLRRELRAACPNGIDVYFDNVAGPVLEAVLGLINVGARIPLCGLISQYNRTPVPPGPNLAPLLVNRARIEGFLIFDHQHRFDAFIHDCASWLRSGDLLYREDIVDGLDAAPKAFAGLLEGRNFGKLLVRVSPDPTARRARKTADGKL